MKLIGALIAAIIGVPFVIGVFIAVTGGTVPTAARGGSPWAAGGARYAAGSGEAIPAATRAAGFEYLGVAPADRQVIEAAVAGSRPEARRLVELVDGLTAVSVAAPGGGPGMTMPTADGFKMVLDLGTVSRQMGARGVNRLVMHELGHVIDGALLSDELRATLDAGIPAGWGCDGGQSGGCAVREERFAESFAKWATNDIGVDVYLGYKVPPPGPSLDAWGAPLARLAAAG